MHIQDEIQTSQLFFKASIICHDPTFMYRLMLHYSQYELFIPGISAFSIALKYVLITSVSLSLRVHP